MSLQRHNHGITEECTSICPATKRTPASKDAHLYRDGVMLFPYDPDEDDDKMESSRG